MNEYTRLAVTVVGFVVTALLGWVASTLMDVKQEQMVVQTQVKELISEDEDLWTRINFIREQVMSLHPMQRSSWIMLGEHLCPVLSDCTEDWHCDDCSCIGGVCGEHPH